MKSRDDLDFIFLVFVRLMTMIIMMGKWEVITEEPRASWTHGVAVDGLDWGEGVEAVQ